MRLQVSGRRRFAMRMRLRPCNRGYAITQRDKLQQVTDELNRRWGTQTSGGIPARSGIEVQHCHRVIVAVRDAPSSPEEAKSVMFFMVSALREQSRIHTTLILAEALGNNVAEIIIDRILCGAQNVGIIVRFCQDQHDVSTGGDSAHRTSSEISSAHPVMLGSPVTNGVSPSGAT
jgi:hypothetical protein